MHVLFIFVKLLNRSQIHYMSRMYVFFNAAPWWLKRELQSLKWKSETISPFHLYIRKTLNPVWDAFDSIWAEDVHRLHHIFTSFSGNTTTQFARFLLYFITCHVPVWDTVPDFIYVKQWWLSYLYSSEKALDQRRKYVSLEVIDC